MPDSKNLTIAEFIAALEKFPEDMEVEITDGFEAMAYKTGQMEFQMFTDSSGVEMIDIGIGGCNYLEGDDR